MEKWINPLEARLPLAPNMRIYCLYGVGKPTERSYWFIRCDVFTYLLRYAEDPFEDGPLADAVGDTQCDCENKTSRNPLDIPFNRVVRPSNASLMISLFALMVR
jgi:phospholipid:diacylglycerol acyltransferase